MFLGPFGPDLCYDTLLLLFQLPYAFLLAFYFATHLVLPLFLLFHFI